MWSIQIDDLGSSWEALLSDGPISADSLNNFTIEIAPDSIYRLQLYDSAEDGTCCWEGKGWFTVTDSTSSIDHQEGTVVWEAGGYKVEEYLEVFFLTDGDGDIQLADFAPSESVRPP